MESDKDDTETAFAYAFFSQELQSKNPNATHSFGELHARVKRHPLQMSRVANILWRGNDPFDVLAIVRREFPDAGYKGIFTTGNYLHNDDHKPLKTIGPLIDLEDFEDGPIKRAPSRMATRPGMGIKGVIINGEMVFIGRLGNRSPH